MPLLDKRGIVIIMEDVISEKEGDHDSGAIYVSDFVASFFNLDCLPPLDLCSFNLDCLTCLMA